MRFLSTLCGPYLQATLATSTKEGMGGFLSHEVLYFQQGCATHMPCTFISPLALEKCFCDFRDLHKLTKIALGFLFFLFFLVVVGFEFKAYAGLANALPLEAHHQNFLL